LLGDPHGPRACRNADLEGLTASTGVACVWIGRSQHRLVTSAYNAGVRSSFVVPLRPPALLGAGGGAAGEERAALQAQIAASAEARAARRKSAHARSGPMHVQPGWQRAERVCRLRAEERSSICAHPCAAGIVGAAPQGRRSGAGESARKAGRAGRRPERAKAAGAPSGRCGAPGGRARPGQRRLHAAVARVCAPILFVTAGRQALAHMDAEYAALGELLEAAKTRRAELQAAAARLEDKQRRERAACAPHPPAPQSWA
jgi:hypothetical protein